MKGRRQTKRLGAAAAAVGLILGVCGCASVQKTDTVQPTVAGQVMESHKASAPAGVSSAPMSVPFIPPPNSIDLCGEPVPLERQDVYERFDKEVTLIVYNHAQVYLWLKRMERYFPIIEERLHQYNLPEDLKYVAIVESDLLPDACSPKGAAGPWQFMPGTGAAYGLGRSGSVDKRYDFEHSTESAFLLLSDLYKKYHSWSLAIAAYNCGDRRILDESRIQGSRDYYDLKLPHETERYVFRILAVKAVLSNPNQYGYDLPKGWGYMEFRLDRVSVSLSRPVPIQTIANAAGTTYREIKRLNPIFRSYDIPAGNHQINLPMGTGKIFEQSFRAGNEVAVGKVSPENSTVEEQDLSAPAAPAVAPAKERSPKAKQKAREKIYLVKKGDSLSAIAQRYQVSTQELKSANKLKSNDLKAGQKLRIP
ncbi:Lytic transglycosylase, catalytic [Syntrophobacter sp. SbD2]|nr:Lytic transglycosylase, catalytic [Syntrophobacter sp. SbD2]